MIIDYENFAKNNPQLLPVAHPEKYLTTFWLCYNGTAFQVFGEDFYFDNLKEMVDSLYAKASMNGNRFVYYRDDLEEPIRFSINFTKEEN